MTDEPVPISAKARAALEQDLAEVRVERDKVAATLTDTDATTGDSADQAEELQRATELDLLDARIRELELRLSESAVAGPPSTDVVGVGSTVSVRFFDDTVETVQIGDLAEALDQTLVTADSPLGRALLGRRAGDTVSYHTPSGQETATVESIG